VCPALLWHGLAAASSKTQLIAKDNPSWNDLYDEITRSTAGCVLSIGIAGSSPAMTTKDMHKPASQPVEIRAISTILDLVILDLVTRGLDPRVPLRRACATRR
jgi:hypothetical protein